MSLCINANIVFNFIFGNIFTFKKDQMGNIDKATLLIIVINVLFSMQGFKNYSFMEQYKFQIAAIKRRDYVRFISSGFLHVDFSHLIFNMLTLFFFADVVIAYLGRFEFVLIYIISLLAGNIMSYFYHKDNDYYSAVGASGAVSGILFAAILLHPSMRIGPIFFPFIPAPIFGALYLGYTIFGMKNQWGNIGHTAHLGGAIAGVVSVLGLHPYLIQTQTQTILWLIIPIVALFILGKRLEK